MTGSQHFSPGDIQFQLIYDRGQCAESSYLKNREEELYCKEIKYVSDLIDYERHLI